MTRISVACIRNAGLLSTPTSIVKVAQASPNLTQDIQHAQIPGTSRHPCSQGHALFSAAMCSIFQQQRGSRYHGAP